MLQRKHASSAGSPIRVALIGAGKVAHTHARILERTPGIELIAVSDIDANRAAAFAARWAIPGSYGDTGKMLRETRPDAVHVMTTPPAHAEAAIQCISAGCHALIEKPMATGTEQCDEIRRAARQYGKTVAVNHTATFNPTFLELIEVVRSRRLGRVEQVIASVNVPFPLSATGLWMLREPGNIIFELGVHTISTLLALTGPVRSASVTLANEVTLNSGKPFYRTWLASLLCERAPLQLHLSFGRDFGDTWISVIGQDGAAMADLRRDTVRVSENTRFLVAMDNLVSNFASIRTTARQALRSFRDFGTGALNLRPMADSYSRIMRASMTDFYGALREGRSPKAGLEQGAEAVAACEAMVRAAGLDAAEAERQREEKLYV